MMKRAVLVLLLFLVVLARADAAVIDEIAFETEEQEQRYHKLIEEMRCPMCLNANLAGSDAPIAADLRTEILEQIQAGRSDAEIIAFMKARYGDFIMYRPPLNPVTALLWFGPILLLLGGFFVLRRLLRNSLESDVESALSGVELQQLDSLLDDQKDQTRS